MNLGATLDLCQKIKSARKQAQFDYYGVIIDQSLLGTREYAVYPVSVPEFESTRHWSVITLREILEQKGDFPHLPYRDRLQLAVVISSSVLQLHGSPWLPNVFSSCEICFVKKRGRLVYDQPFIMKNLPGNEPGRRRDEIIVPFQCNPALLSLGILLIELVLGKTLASLRTPQEASLAGESPLVDYITAQRVAGQIRMTSLNYGTAVTRCISGDLHRDGGFDAEDFCQDVYSGVVALLEKDLECS